MRESPPPAALSAVRRVHRHALLWFVVANFVLANGIGHGYIRTAGGEAWSSRWWFVNEALFDQLATGCLALGALLLLLVQVGSSPLPVRVLAAATFTTVQAFLYVDQLIFSFFKFHINGLVVNVLTTTGGWESMHIAPAEIRQFVVVGLGLLLAEFAGFGVLVRVCRPRTPATLSVTKRWGVLLAVTVCAALADRTVYALSDLHNDRETTRSARLLVPLYQPLTIKSLAGRLGGDANAASLHFEQAKPTDLLKYPLHPLHTKAPAVRPNIVWLVLDSWRYDSFNAETTPEMWALGARSQVFERQISGGNCTRYGIFSMFYGIHGNYWQNVLNWRQGPVLMSRLKELDYRIRVLSSSTLQFPEFRETVFVDVPQDIRDQWTEPTSRSRDRAMIDDLQSFVASSPAGQPFFAFLFFESTHAPYDFEPDSAIYRPYVENFRYTAMTDERNREPIRNRYLNAVHYVDGLVGDAIKSLDREGRMADTLVILTGDHGEEFHEHGYWGHNGAFTPEQVHVPMVIYVPGAEPRHIERRTEHQDLPPALLGMLGVESPTSDFAQGRPIFDDEPEPFQVSCSWDECALLDDDGALVFGTEVYNASETSVLDDDYKELKNPRTALQRRQPELVRLVSEMSTFNQ